ncbi:unnamed protein product [Lampetra fluviatilis]
MRPRCCYAAITALLATLTLSGPGGQSVAGEEEATIGDLDQEIPAWLQEVILKMDYRLRWQETELERLVDTQTQLDSRLEQLESQRLDVHSLADYRLRWQETELERLVDAQTQLDSRLEQLESQRLDVHSLAGHLATAQDDPALMFRDRVLGQGGEEDEVVA